MTPRARHLQVVDRVTEARSGRTWSEIHDTERPQSCGTKNVGMVSSILAVSSSMIAVGQPK